jgi:hypothetical protein
VSIAHVDAIHGLLRNDQRQQGETENGGGQHVRCDSL